MQSIIPKYYQGSKSVTIYNPSFFKTLVESGAFTPIITPLKVARDGAVMYTINIRDNNKDVLLDVQIGLPESISHTVKLGTSSDNSIGLEAIWETNDSESELFKRDVNSLLELWLVKIQNANFLGDEQPKIYLPSQACPLKWPWKNSTNEEYFVKFKRDSSTHIIRIGVGYYSSDKNYCAVSLQLSNYPGKTQNAIVSQRVSRKKRKVDSDEEEKIPSIENFETE